MKPFEYKPNGKYDHAVNPKQCKASVMGARGWSSYQCSRKIWKDGWCKQHHPDTVAKRDKLYEEKYKAKEAASPFGQLQKIRKCLKKYGCRDLQCASRMKMKGREV